MTPKLIGLLFFAYASYMYGQEIPKCNKDSFKEEGDSCLGELIPIDDEKCNEDSFKEEGDSCLGELIPIEDEECNEDSFKEEGDSCLGELIPIEDDNACNEDSFMNEMGSCLGELIPIDEIEECKVDSFIRGKQNCLGELIPWRVVGMECIAESFADPKAQGSCIGELIKIEESPECNEDSFINEIGSCLGELIPIEEIEECEVDSFIRGKQNCLGELIPWRVVGMECIAESFADPRAQGSCIGELIRIEEGACKIGTGCECDLVIGCTGLLINIPFNPKCTVNSFISDDATCMGELIRTGPGKCEEFYRQSTCDKMEISMVCFDCAAPIRLDTQNTTAELPKTLCDGEGSFNTVYSQRCKARSDDRSTCMMGSEGFSFCDTEHLWWRDDHWYDWDLCSLCTHGTSSTQQGPLTTSGYLCAGECHNAWNNRESLAPRCKVTKKAGDNNEQIPDKDYCTTCVGNNCPDKISAPSDDRPGSKVGHISWQEEETKDKEEEY